MSSTDLPASDGQPHLVPLVGEQLGRLLSGCDLIAEVDAVEPVDRRHGPTLGCRACRSTPASPDRPISTRSPRRSRVAFHNDPVWSWAFPDDDAAARAVPSLVAAVRRERAAARLHVDGARHGATTAIAVWTPPGVPELTHEAEARIPALLDELLGDAGAVRARGSAPVRGRAPARRAALLPRLRRDPRRPPRARASASSCSRRTSS